jgi:hypothetical protein
MTAFYDERARHDGACALGTGQSGLQRRAVYRENEEREAEINEAGHQHASMLLFSKKYLL